MFIVQAYKAYKLGGKVSELLYSPALYGIDLSAQNMPKPRARCSPMVAVVGNTLWLFGGTVEVSSYSPTLNTPQVPETRHSLPGVHHVHWQQTFALM
jgi:hypothetical protein